MNIKPQVLTALTRVVHEVAAKPDATPQQVRQAAVAHGLDPEFLTDFYAYVEKTQGRAAVLQLQEGGIHELLESGGFDTQKLIGGGLADLHHASAELGLLTGRKGLDALRQNTSLEELGPLAEQLGDFLQTLDDDSAMTWQRMLAKLEELRAQPNKAEHAPSAGKLALLSAWIRENRVTRGPSGAEIEAMFCNPKVGRELDNVDGDTTGVLISNAVNTTHQRTADFFLELGAVLESAQPAQVYDAAGMSETEFESSISRVVGGGQVDTGGSAESVGESFSKRLSELSQFGDSSFFDAITELASVGIDGARQSPQQNQQRVLSSVRQRLEAVRKEAGGNADQLLERLAALSNGEAESEHFVPWEADFLSRWVREDLSQRGAAGAMPEANDVEAYLRDPDAMKRHMEIEAFDSRYLSAFSAFYGPMYDSNLRAVAALVDG